jgi:hypothetical protein
MSEEKLDPRYERLVAALYGELSGEEEEELRRRLAAEPDLRAEWEELQGARAFLKEWAVDDAGPLTVFVDPERPDASAPARRGLRSRFRTWFPAPAWGFAAAALALVVLLFAGLRIDRVDGGLALRFGSEAPPPHQLMAGPGGRSLDVGASGSTPAAIPASADVALSVDAPVPASTATPVARPAMATGDWDTYASGVLAAVSVMLNDYQTQRNAELAMILRAFQEELRRERQREYNDLKARVQGVGLGLLAEQSRTNARIETLIDRGPWTLDGSTPLNQEEDH